MQGWGTTGKSILQLEAEPGKESWIWVILSLIGVPKEFQGELVWPIASEGHSARMWHCDIFLSVIPAWWQHYASYTVSLCPCQVSCKQSIEVIQVCKYKSQNNCLTCTYCGVFSYYFVYWTGCTSQSCRYAWCGSYRRVPDQGQH